MAPPARPSMAAVAPGGKLQGLVSERRQAHHCGATQPTLPQVILRGGRPRSRRFLNAMAIRTCMAETSNSVRPHMLERTCPGMNEATLQGWCHLGLASRALYEQAILVQRIAWFADVGVRVFGVRFHCPPRDLVAMHRPMNNSGVGYGCRQGGCARSQGCRS